MIPPYGPKWRYKIPVYSKVEWQIIANHGPFRRNQIFVAFWNRKRIPKRLAVRRKVR